MRSEAISTLHQLIRLATFNVQHGRRPDGEVDIELAAEACASLRADVLSLQEVGDEQAASIATAGAMHLAFGPAIVVRGRGYGNALLSRQPIEDVVVLDLPSPAHEPRSAVVGTTMGIAVAAGHLGLRGTALPQVPVVLDALRARPAPRALLGDLNLDAADVLAEGFTRVDTPATWPVKAPRRTIDHVLLDGLTPSAVDVVHLRVSDHRAVVVTCR